MINLPKIFLNELKDVFLLANVPEFLYYEFRAKHFVRDFANDNSISEIVLTFNQINKKTKIKEKSKSKEIKKNDLELQVLKYLLIIALSMKPDLKAITALKSLDLSNLVWGDELRKLVLASELNSTTISVDLKSPYPESKFSIVPEENIANPQPPYFFPPKP